MNTSQLKNQAVLLLSPMLLAMVCPNTKGAAWPQWGGPSRNFSADTSALADKWPEQGPRRIWERELGTGYSGIAVDKGVLYTMYRKDKQDKDEYSVAIDAATGKTLWRHKERAAVPEEVDDYGKRFTGPNATPLVIGDRVYTVGRNAILLCLQASDGKKLWKQDLKKDLGAQTHICGFSSSPIAYGKTIILPIGRLEDDKEKGRSLVAFDQETGEIVWKNQSFQSWHSSPILITYGGQEQLIHCTNSALIGVRPADGSLLWDYPYPDLEQFEGIWITPVWDGKDTILFSSRRVGCTVRLTKQDSKIVAEEIWSSRKTPLGMGTPILLGDVLVGAKRGQNAAFFAVDIQNGKRIWFERLFPGATILGDSEKLIILDSNGVLALATANRDGLTVASQCQLTEQYSFTAPSLVGTTLFVRDEKRIMALDLSVEGSRDDDKSHEGRQASAD